MYTTKPDGLIGNEDCGQMSAWYVMSTMGFYSVTPGTKEFAIGTPLFKELKIHLENGKTFVSKAYNADVNNFYILSSSLNNKAYNKSLLRYDNIQNGDTLIYEMTNKPNKEWAFGTGYYPVSAITDELILRNPIIGAASKTFKTKQSITIYSNEKDCDIFYTKDGTTPSQTSLKYTTPFDIDTTTTIKAIIINSKGIKSLTTTAFFYKTSTDWKITILSKYNSQYTAGGDEGIIDGLNGSIDWRKGEWQGYQGQDFESIIDLGKAMRISIIAANFLQDTRSWILMPPLVEFYTSTDGKEFTLFGTTLNTIADTNYTIQTKNFICAKKYFTNAKYIKVKAKNYGKLPDWHEGKGGDAYIFIDEIRVK